VSLESCYLLESLPWKLVQTILVEIRKAFPPIQTKRISKDVKKIMYSQSADQDYYFFDIPAWKV
jgi:hypothetical protein